MKPTTGTITLRDFRGEPMGSPVEATIVGSFGIHRPIFPAPGGGWRVTHVQTGSMMGEFGTEVMAIRFIGIVSKLPVAWKSLRMVTKGRLHCQQPLTRPKFSSEVLAALNAAVKRCGGVR